MGIQRRVALIGSGEGPWISTQGLREPRVKITGLKEGGHVYIQMTRDPRDEEREERYVTENGVHVLTEYAWMRVRCVGGGRNVICDILTKKAVA